MSKKSCGACNGCENQCRVDAESPPAPGEKLTRWTFDEKGPFEAEYGQFVKFDECQARAIVLLADCDQFKRMYSSASKSLCGLGELLGVPEEDQCPPDLLRACRELVEERDGLKAESFEKLYNRAVDEIDTLKALVCEASEWIKKNSCHGTDAICLWERMDKAAPAAKGDQSPILDWAVSRWVAEVSDRPLRNVHRRAIDDTWRQVIKRLGGNDLQLCGPTHDDLMAAAKDGESKGEAIERHFGRFGDGES